jgi:hypothetical protein
VGKFKKSLIPGSQCQRSVFARSGFWGPETDFVGCTLP